MVGNKDDKPLLAFYTFNFVVQAKTFEEAKSIIRNTLDIRVSRNDSKRKINGIYLISHSVEEKQLTKYFYKKIKESHKISIHSDQKSAQLYPKILAETQVVEERMRWLLLHVSDAIEDFTDQLSEIGGAKKGSDINTRESLDPITSTITFESMLELLSLDQSWAHNTITTKQMRDLIEQSTDFTEFRKGYIERTTERTVWSSISSLILQKNIEWKLIKPKLKKIKELRNKCAHFRTVSDDDLNQAQYLRKELDGLLAEKEQSSDSKTLQSLNTQITQLLKPMVAQIHVPTISPLALDSLFRATGSLKSMQNIQKLQLIPYDDILKVTQSVMPCINLASSMARTLCSKSVENNSLSLNRDKGIEK